MHSSPRNVCHTATINVGALFRHFWSGDDDCDVVQIRRLMSAAAVTAGRGSDVVWHAMRSSGSEVPAPTPGFVFCGSWAIAITHRGTEGET